MHQDAEAAEKEQDDQGAAPGATAGPVLGPTGATVLLLVAGLVFGFVGFVGCQFCGMGISAGTHQQASLELLPPNASWRGHDLLGKEAVAARALGEALLTRSLPWAALAGT